jgi:hypothetical protein
MRLTLAFQIKSVKLPARFGNFKNVRKLLQSRPDSFHSVARISWQRSTTRLQQQLIGAVLRPLNQGSQERIGDIRIFRRPCHSSTKDSFVAAVAANRTREVCTLLLLPPLPLLKRLMLPRP